MFYAELNELLTRELAEDGYSGVEVRVTPMRTEIIIRATRTQSVLGARPASLQPPQSLAAWIRVSAAARPRSRLRPAGEKGRRIRELTAVVQKRFKFPEGSVELYAEKVANRGLCAVAQAESLRYKLLGGLAVRRACYGVLRFVMESGAKGCEVIVSGKLRAQRAKSMKFKDGYMVSSGQPVKEFVDGAVRHVMLRQGVIGVKVKIMLDWDPTGKTGPKKPLPDMVTVHKPKEEESIDKPFIGRVASALLSVCALLTPSAEKRTGEQHLSLSGGGEMLERLLICNCRHHLDSLVSGLLPASFLLPPSSSQQSTELYSLRPFNSLRVILASRQMFARFCPPPPRQRACANGGDEELSACCSAL